MRLICNKLMVADLAKATAFYEDVLHQEVYEVFDDMIVFKSNIALVSLSRWSEKAASFNQNVTVGFADSILHFEESHFDLYLFEIESRGDIRFLHRVVKRKNGQRLIRFFDPDNHVIEVSEANNRLPDDLMASLVDYNEEVDILSCTEQPCISHCSGIAFLDKKTDKKE